MKVLVCAIALFLLVTIFVTINSIVLSNLFSDINDKLSLLPKTKESLDVLSDDERNEAIQNLDYISKKWKKYESYIFVTLEHNVSGEFYDQFLPAKEYFKAGDFPSYLACLSSAKDILWQIKTNESLSFGTIF